MNSVERKAKEREHDYVCVDCGKQFMHPNDTGSIHTFSESECCICEEVKGTTHVRAYNYLRKYYGTIKKTKEDS